MIWTHSARAAATGSEASPAAVVASEAPLSLAEAWLLVDVLRLLDEPLPAMLVPELLEALLPVPLAFVVTALPREPLAALEPPLLFAPEDVDDPLAEVCGTTQMPDASLPPQAPLAAATTRAPTARAC